MGPDRMSMAGFNNYYVRKHKFERNRNFIHSFRLCSYIIPQRVGVRFLAPYAGIPPLRRSGHIPLPGRLSLHQPGAATAANSPACTVEYEESTQNGNHGEQFLSSPEDYPEALALSPAGSNESFETVGNDGAELISISDSGDESDSENNGYNDYNCASGYNNHRERLQVVSSVSGEPRQYQSENSRRVLWEGLLSNLPATQRPYENARYHKPISGRSSPKTGSDGFKKRKFLAATDGNTGGEATRYTASTPGKSFAFTTSHSIPDTSPQAITALHQALFCSLNALGINVTLTTPSPPSTFYGSRRSTGVAEPAQTRYRSRLFPRENWASDSLYNRTFASIRAVVEEGGYVFHGIGYSPNLQIAGTPVNNNAVNPAWRSTVLHGCLMELQPVGITPAQARERDARARAYWRKGGRGVFSVGGERYKRLIGVKEEADLWGVFWARTTVGSEGWEVLSEDGYPFSQNGRLCKV
ncbi:hypothetical protein QBC37DRAFT_459285 [Rhypophila decipiens]|uniref:Uncharacterized protein n=1 Tax=Rhypophila decipiens TaxID=261697 RepID=A0AAN6XT30_9PEZI|nr:hypothetical protein QBC37DRAFT_459285 [Rhypophila decipiens]